MRLFLHYHKLCKGGVFREWGKVEAKSEQLIKSSEASLHNLWLHGVVGELARRFPEQFGPQRSVAGARARRLREGDSPVSELSYSVGDWPRRAQDYAVACNILSELAGEGQAGSVRSAERAGKRGKQRTEKWRRARSRMAERLRQETLPKSLRDAAKAIGSTYSTTRRAAHKSRLLRSHSGLHPDGNGVDAGGGSLLEEMTGQVDQRTRVFMEQMNARKREDTEAELQQMEPEQQVALLKVLAKDPDAGSTGDVSLIEDADQDSRLDDLDD